MLCYPILYLIFDCIWLYCIVLHCLWNFIFMIIYILCIHVYTVDRAYQLSHQYRHPPSKNDEESMQPAGAKVPFSSARHGGPLRATNMLQSKKKKKNILGVVVSPMLYDVVFNTVLKKASEMRNDWVWIWNKGPTGQRLPAAGLSADHVATGASWHFGAADGIDSGGAKVESTWPGQTPNWWI